MLGLQARDLGLERRGISFDPRVDDLLSRPAQDGAARGLDSRVDRRHPLLPDFRDHRELARLQRLPDLVEKIVADADLRQVVHGASDRSRSGRQREPDRSAEEPHQAASEQTDGSSDRALVGFLFDGDLSCAVFRDHGGCVDRDASFGIQLLENSRALVGLALVLEHGDKHLVHKLLLRVSDAALSSAKARGGRLR